MDKRSQRELSSVHQAEDTHDETGSEQAHSEASTQADIFQIAGSKRARSVWKETSKSRAIPGATLTPANIAAAGLENGSSMTPELISRNISTQQRPSNSCLEGVHKSQTLITNFGFQAKPGPAKMASSALQYVQELLNAHDSVDILSLSIALGCLSEFGAEASVGNDAQTGIDSCVLFAVGELRRIVSSLSSYIVNSLDAGDLRCVVNTIAFEAMHRFNTSARFSTNGNPFLFTLAKGDKCEFNTMARTTFCHAIWFFFQEDFKSRGESVRLPELSACKLDKRWLLCLKCRTEGSSRYFDLSSCENSLQEGIAAAEEVHCELGSVRVFELNDLVQHLLHAFLHIEYMKIKHKSKWICAILAWDRNRDLSLCCFLPFVELVEKLLVEGRICDRGFPELQSFCKRHIEHSDTAKLNEIQSGSNGSDVGELERMLTRIRSHLGRRVAGCDARSVSRAALDIGDFADKLLKSKQ